MRMVIFVALIVCAGLTNSTALSAAEMVDGSWPSDAPIEFDAMHRAVSSDFLEPASAQYKQLVLRQPLGRNYQVICGWVNSRNVLGGYAPFVPFVYEIADNKAFLASDFKDEFTGELAMMALRMSGCPDHALGL